MAKRSISNASCTATVMDRGATIISWHPEQGHEALFATRDANPAAEFHGGIPICAPWFGKGRDEVVVPRPHGLVRWVDWDFQGVKDLNGATKLTWTLDQAAVAHLPGADAYPADLRYTYEATFGARLDVALTIESPTEPTIVDQAFHTYFLVNNVRQAEVHGLDGAPYRDYLDDLATGIQSGVLEIPGHHDTIYYGALDSGGVEIRLPDRILSIDTEGARDVIVWNPGPDYASELKDFADDDWPRMLCVEVGNVQHHAVAIPAGGSHTMAMTIRVASRGHSLMG